MRIKKNRNQIEIGVNKKVYPSIILFKKTLFKDIAVFPKVLVSIFLIISIPLLLLAFVNNEWLAPTTSIFETAGLGYVILIFSISLMFSLIMSMLAAPLISTEKYTGTMLILISKPISRTNIVLTKFLAVLLYGCLLSFLSLSLICLIYYIKYPFYDILPFLLLNFLYSLQILFFFQCITIGLSCLIKRPRNVMIIPVALITFLFLIFLVFKPFITFNYGSIGPAIYESAQLYHFDLSYHFMNIFYYLFNNLLDIQISESFLGTYGLMKQQWLSEDPWDWTLVDANYYPPWASFIVLISIACIVLFIGYYFFKNKDIHS